jgi:hypothetical protein
MALPQCIEFAENLYEWYGKQGRALGAGRSSREGDEEGEQMRARLAVIGVSLGLILAGTAAPLRAHHAFAAEFDANRPVSFRGTVTKMEWINPHVWIHLTVQRPNGPAEEWAVEGATPSVLFRRGFTKQSLLPGTEISVDGYQAKDGTKRATGRDLTFPDGRTLFLGSSGTGAPYELTPDNQKVPAQK